MLQDEERELLPPEHNSKEVKVINDLLEDLTKLDRRQDPGERIPLAAVLGTTYRAHNNNSGVAGVARLGLSKQSSLLSSGSRGSGHESVIIDSHSDSRVSSFSGFYPRDVNSFRRRLAQLFVQKSKFDLRRIL